MFGVFGVRFFSDISGWKITPGGDGFAALDDGMTFFLCQPPLTEEKALTKRRLDCCLRLTT